MSARRGISSLFSLPGAVLCLVLILVAVQAVLWKRILALEEGLRAGRGRQESVDRGLISLERTVETLASPRAKTEVNPPASVAAAGLVRASAPAAPGAAPGGPSPAETGKPPPQKAPDLEDEEEEPTGPLENLADSLARRKQLLEGIRARLSLLDLNSDRQVSLQEFDGDVADFLHFDKNGNGRVSLSEIQGVLKVEEQALRRVAAADRDRDGRVSPAEFRGSPRRFRSLDQNGDGAVTAEEYVAEHWRFVERLDRDDLNNDHKLAPDEFGAGSAKFLKYDKNKDGFLDRSELKTLLLHERS